MPNNNAALNATIDSLTKLIEQGAELGAGTLQSLMRTYPRVLQGLGKFVSGIHISTCDSCEIPPPCWMPKLLCPVTSLGRPGDKASLCFSITNCSMAIRNVAVFTSTKIAGLTFSAVQLNLGPMEHGEIDVSYLIPITSKVGQKIEILMWVRACRLHFLRWKIIVSPIGVSTCYQVEVEDCPDLIHHWYDHFYCPRPCIEERSNRG
jgi:hypothetical protein